MSSSYDRIKPNMNSFESNQDIELINLVRPPPQRTKNSRIHAKNFRNSRIHASFSQNSRKPDFSGNRGNSRKKSGKFVQFLVKRENSRVHAKSRADSRIHAIEKCIFTFAQVFSIHAFTQFLFRFSRAFTQPKKPIHAFTQTAGGPPFSISKVKIFLRCPTMVGNVKFLFCSSI